MSLCGSVGVGSIFFNLASRSLGSIPPACTHLTYPPSHASITKASLASSNTCRREWAALAGNVVGGGAEELIVAEHRGDQRAGGPTVVRRGAGRQPVLHAEAGRELPKKGPAEEWGRRGDKEAPHVSLGSQASEGQFACHIVDNIGGNNTHKH